MPHPKVSLFDQAEAVGQEADAAHSRVQRYAEGHPDDPLPPDHHWIAQARALASARLTLSLMALDEEASRKFVASLMGRDDAKMLVAMLKPLAPRSKEAKAA